MNWVAAVAAVGAGCVAAGGLLGLARGLTTGLGAQAVGVALLGVVGFAVLADGEPVGAGFRSAVDPALGVDALSGFFLLVLCVIALPALAFAREALPSSRRGGVLAALTAAFLLAMAGLVAARDVTTFLAGWELMTLIPASAILVAARAGPPGLARPAPRRRRLLQRCEHELTAAAGPDYDLQRFGLNVVASPRHADVLLVTGTVTTRMAEPLRAAYEAMPDPRLVAALGDCAVLGAGAFAHPDELADPLETILPVDLYVPGCPPAPDRIAAALVGALALLRPVAPPDRRPMIKSEDAPW